MDNIGGFCNAADSYRRITKRLQHESLLVPKDGESDKMIENPLVSTQIKYAKEMREFALRSGITLDGRLKIAAKKASEIEDDITDEFGDI